MIEFATSTKHEMMYNEAVLYCTFCNHKGYNDWRLPTQNEWSNHEDIPYGVWYENETNLGDSQYCVLPVRDI